MSIPMKFVQKRGTDEQGKPVTESFAADCECDDRHDAARYSLAMALDNAKQKPDQHYGKCAGCGHQFTEQEYNDRHSHSEEEYCPECCPACNDEKRIVELEKQITALKTALEFYANPATYKHVMTERGIEIPIINDNGEIARAALDGWSSGEIRELEDGE